MGNSKKPGIRKTRNQKGNLYVLYVGLIALLIGVFYTGASLTLDTIYKHRIKHALEAAALACANDLSQIVINDPYWGYVALTDHPPVGCDTIAGDNEPLPVTGINTIVGTARQELLLAHAIGTAEAIDCAMVDVAAARRTQKALEDYLRETLSSKTSIAKDLDGNSVKPLVEARRVYEENTKGLNDSGKFHLDSFRAELGYLNSLGTTNCPMPGFGFKTEDSKFCFTTGKYPAFVNVPVKAESFYFAGLGEQSGLVDTAGFRHGDGEKMCSIVRLTAVFSGSPRGKENGDSGTVEPVESFKIRACAQPFYTEDRTKPPILALSLPHGLPSGIKTTRDLLGAHVLKSRGPLLTATGGDYPAQAEALLKPDFTKPETTIKSAFTRAYFDWIRSAHCNINLDSVIESLDMDLVRECKTAPAKTILFCFGQDKRIQFVKPKSVPFRNQITQENQLYSLGLNSIKTAQYCWTFKLRDQVHRLGTIKGGKHAGQPMPSIAYIKELKNLTEREVRLNTDDRFSSRARSRYDQSRLAVELEISAPLHLSLAKSPTEGGL